jgi:uncharacterized MAPEG superfamily protein
MTIPVWVLLGFAAWTLLTLFTTIGVYRWTRILTGRASIAEWRADEVQGSEWHRRALRAHMNCVENLPVYTATVVVVAINRVTITAGLTLFPSISHSGEILPQRFYGIGHWVINGVL